MYFQFLFLKIAVVKAVNLSLDLEPPFCSALNWVIRFILFYLFFLVLPVYCYQPISLHPHAYMLSHVTPWTAARQTPLSMDFSRQEYWCGLPFPSPSGSFLIQTGLCGTCPFYIWTLVRLRENFQPWWKLDVRQSVIRITRTHQFCLMTMPLPSCEYLKFSSTVNPSSWTAGLSGDWPPSSVL